MRLRVVTWNLHGSAEPDVGRVAAVLADLKPDLVGLQEVRPGQARRLAMSLGWRHRWVRKHLPYGPLLWRAEGLAVLSAHDLDGNGRTVLNPGSSPFSYRRRVAQTTRLDLGDETITVVNTHLASHRAPEERIAQATVAAGLLAVLAPEQRAVAVLTGDLNAADEPATLAPFRRLGLADAWDSIGGPGSTNPAVDPTQRLDYILVGPAWRVIGGRVASEASIASLSDHLPVVIELTRSAG